MLFDISDQISAIVPFKVNSTTCSVYHVINYRCILCRYGYGTST